MAGPRPDGSTPNTPALRVRNLGKSYGTGAAERHILLGLDLDVAPGEFLCIVGPSGVGKTTLLRCLSGLLAPSSGRVEIQGAVVTAPPDTLAVVFQDYSRSLLPWMSVWKNVELPLKGKGLNKTEIHRRCTDALASVGLAGRESAYPGQLSGGMQQRVAIARALAYRPSLLIMDEPFASVDAQTRAELEDLLLVLRAEYQVTIVFVTHDVDEAVYLGDRVIVLGGTPATVVDSMTTDLGDQRDQITTKALPQFAELRAQVLTRIKRAH